MTMMGDHSIFKCKVSVSRSIRRSVPGFGEVEKVGETVVDDTLHVIGPSEPVVRAWLKHANRFKKVFEILSVEEIDIDGTIINFPY